MLRGAGGRREAHPVAGLGQPKSNHVAVRADLPGGRRNVAYVRRYGRGGDYSWNCNNYVHDDTARIRSCG